MIVVFLFYGLAIFGLGLAATLYLRQGSDLPLRNQLPWLAGVAFATACVILALNLSLISSLIQGDISAQTSFLLLLGLYRPLFALRYIALFVGVGWLGLTAVFLKPFSDETVTNQSVSKSTPL